ncbi:MAG: hypothetical protein V1899_02980 [Planctomycetota bacterium]
MANWASHQEQLIGLPVAKRARYGIHFTRPDGLVQADFVGKPCHYLDTANEWQPIDTALKPVGAEFSAPGIPIFFRADGSIRAGTHAQQTKRIGLFTPGTRAFSPLATLPDGKIDGDSIVRSSGIFEHRMRLTEHGACSEMIVASMPSGKANDWLVFETLVSDPFGDGDLQDFQSAGYRFPPPTVTDANGKRLLAKRITRQAAGKQIIFTGVPLAALANAKFPVAIDPDFTSDTADDAVYGQSGTYATARSTSTGLFGGALLYVGQTLLYECDRSFLKVDTSSIGGGNTVTQVNWKLTTGTLEVSGVNFDIVIIKQDWSAQDPLAAGNREAAYDNCLAGTADDNIWQNSLALANNTRYTSGNLNTAYINKTGITYYSLISSRDIAATQPVGPYEYAPIRSANDATPGNRPVLAAVYSTAARAPIFFFM